MSTQGEGDRGRPQETTPRPARPRAWAAAVVGGIAGAALAVGSVAAWSAWGPSEWNGVPITDAALEGDTVRIDYLSGSCIDGERATAVVEATRVTVDIEGRQRSPRCTGTAVGLPRTTTLTLPTGADGLPVFLADGRQLGTAPSRTG